MRAGLKPGERVHHVQDVVHVETPAGDSQDREHGTDAPDPTLPYLRGRLKHPLETTEILQVHVLVVVEVERFAAFGVWASGGAGEA